MDYSYGSSSILGFYRYWKSVFLKNFCATLEWFIRAKYFAISRTWLIMLQNYLFGQYSRVSNKHRLLNKSSLNFYITILIHFYINLGISVIFWFFFHQHFQNKKIWFINKRRPTTIRYSRVLTELHNWSHASHCLRTKNSRIFIWQESSLFHRVTVVESVQELNFSLSIQIKVELLPRKNAS